MNDPLAKQPGKRARVSSAVETGRTVVTVTGEVDHVGAVRLTGVLEAAAALSGTGDVPVDFSRVGFCDCSGLNTLLAARNHCQDLGIRFSLSEPVTLPVARLFQLTGAGPLLLRQQTA
ncbi:STAS domain-containing protein [Streptomyces flaveolus]|uniref:STAS domain-containing protein n=1 Tax=Streptomyces flaveolus TaxID=67297 RepID=UPI0036FEA819